MKTSNEVEAFDKQIESGGQDESVSDKYNTSLHRLEKDLVSLAKKIKERTLLDMG